MSAQLVSILVLMAMFVLATTLSINMGALAFAGAFLVGPPAGGMDAKNVDRDRFFKQLLAYGGIVVAVAPLVVWLAFVVPNFG